MKWAVCLIITAKCVCYSGDWWLAVCYLVSKIYFLYFMTILHTLVKIIQYAGVVFLLWILSLLEF